MTVLGEVQIPCKITGKKAKIKFKVIREWTYPILGAETCEKLNLIKRIYTATLEEEDIFKGLGCVKNFVYDIDLIENPKFEICPPRRVPYKIRDEVKRELDRMTEMSVIEPIAEVTPSVSPMVFVK